MCLTVLPASARVGCAGTLDPSFDAGRGEYLYLWPPWAPAPITSVTPQPDGKVVIAGGFEQAQGLEVPGIARYDATGRIDSNYVANPADIISHQRIAQPDGKILQIEITEGTFVRLNQNGSVDTTFAPALPAGFTPRALALQPDGKILVAGGVYHYDSTANAQSIIAPVIRLWPSGAADNTFLTNTVAGLGPNEWTAGGQVAVYDLVQQADGRIYIGGFFTTINGIRRTDVARLNADGWLDPAFEPDLVVHTGWDTECVETISALGLAPDGKLYVAGYLGSFNGFERPAVARLNSADNGCGGGIITFENPIYYTHETNGTVAVTLVRTASTNEAATANYQCGLVNYFGQYWATADEDFTNMTGSVSFAPGQVSQTVQIPILNDNQLETTEYFYVSLANLSNAVTLNDQASAIVMIFDDESAGLPGTINENLAPLGLDGPVKRLGLAPDGAFLVAGSFTHADGQSRAGLARFTSTGQLVASFNPVVDGPIADVAVEPATGNLLLAGTFEHVNGTPRHAAARLNAEGALDTAFVPNVAGAVSCIVPCSDGKILIGGTFTNVSGAPRQDLARFNANGTVDSSFNAGTVAWSGAPTNTITSIAVQGDGKILIAGFFNSIQGSSRPWLARLNSDGVLDPLFAPTITTNPVLAIKVYLQPDGKILVATVQQFQLWDIRSVLLRLNANGTQDAAFHPAYASLVLAVQPDGKIVIDGPHRLLPDGSLDPDFFIGTGFAGAVSDLLLLPGGDLLAGGEFTSAHGYPYAYVARIYGGSSLNFSRGYFEFASPIYSVNQGATSAIVQVQRLWGAFGAAAVDYTTRDGSASNALDYVARAGTLSFADGETGPKSLIIPLLHNPNLDGNGYFYILLTNAVGGAGLEANTTATVNLVDTNVVIRIYPQVVSVNESAGTVAFQVIMTGHSSANVTCQYATRNGTATAGSDFTPVSGTFNFGTGPYSVNWFQVPILNDSTAEGSETFTVYLTNASGGAVLRASSAATVTIIDDDNVQPVVSLAEALDATNLSWSTGSNYPWHGQSSITHDGVDAAEVRLVEPETQGWLSTAVEGPGNLSFYWKTYCNGDLDYLLFYIDDQQAAIVWAEYDMPWQHLSFDIPSGTHNLKWVFESHSPVSPLYGAWLDEVTFAQAPYITRQPLGVACQLGQAVTFSVEAAGQPPLTYQWFHNGVTMAGANQATFSIPAVTQTNLGSYTVAVTNALGAVISRPAVLALSEGTDGWLWAEHDGSDYWEITRDMVVDEAGNAYRLSVYWVPPYGDWEGDFLLSKYTPAGTKLWTRHLQGDMEPWETGRLALDGQGNPYMSGINFSWMNLGGVTLSNSYYHLFIARFDTNGQALWAVQVPASDDDDYFDWAVDAAGNSYVTGRGMYLNKYNPSGQLVWSFERDHSIGTTLSIDASGNVYISGYYYQNLTLSGGVTLPPQEAWAHFVAKFDSNGQPIWAFPIATQRPVTDRAGNTWFAAVEGPLLSNTGEWINAGNGWFVAQVDAGGNLLNLQQVDGNLGLAGLALDANDNLYLSGSLTGPAHWNGEQFTPRSSNDWVLVKVASGGETLWSVQEPGNDIAIWTPFLYNTSPGAPRLDRQGNVYLASMFVDTRSFGTNAFVSQGLTDFALAKYNPMGQLLWAAWAGGPDYDSLTAWGLDGLGNVYVAGDFNVGIVFGTNILSDWGHGDLYLAKFGLPTTPPIAERILPAFYSPEVTFTVQLTATPAENINNYALEDQPPAGWAVSNISHEGVFDAGTGKVKFGPFYDHTARTFSYALTPPAGATGRKYFTGSLSCDGVSSPVGGAFSTLNVSLHPADITAADNLVTINEVTAYGAAWRTGAVWPQAPNPIPIAYVTRAAYLWRAGECYRFDLNAITEPLMWVPCQDGLALAANMQPSGSAASSLPSIYIPGQPLTIAITITPQSGALACAVEDQLPPGWTPSNISDQGEFDAARRKVKWGPFYNPVARTLSYQASPPLNSSGSASFSGVISFDGSLAEITGPRLLQSGSRLSLIPQTQSGRFDFVMDGELGRTYRIETSTDLKTWTELVTLTNTTGRLEISDPGRANTFQRFYRAKLIQ